MYDIAQNNRLSAVRPRGVNDWFDHMFRPISEFSSFTKTTDGNYVAEFDVPGFGEGDIEITVENKILALNGNKENRKINYRVAIPDKSDVDNGKATIKNGVLKITLPMSESAKPKQIKVKGD